MDSIRYATEADLPFCAKIDFSIKNIDALRKKAGAKELIVALSNGVPIGYLRLEWLWGKIPYMSVIHITDAWQKRGVGKALLEFLESELRTLDATQLLTSSEEHSQALAWHDKRGFLRCGYIDGLNPNGDREVFLSKPLGN